MSSKQKYLRVTMPDGSKWDVPAEMIVQDMARRYPGKNIVAEDCNLKDWAANNMNWSDVEHRAMKHQEPPPPGPVDFQEGWVNGEKEIVWK